MAEINRIPYEYSYRSAPLTDALAALELDSGGIYHQLTPGEVNLRGDNQSSGISLAAVNRSYSPNSTGNRLFVGITRQPQKFAKDKLIHENVPSAATITADEYVLNLAGRDFLYLNAAKVVSTYSSLAEHSRRSDIAQGLLASLNENLEASSKDYSLGVYGSHQLGLNSVDSDLDLVAAITEDSRTEFLQQLAASLANLGFRNTNSGDKLWEYAQRYSRRLSVPLAAGAYLARKRHRWSNSQGLDLSLQLLNSNAWPGPLENFWNIWNEPWKTEAVETKVQVIDSRGAYNFPRSWLLTLSGKTIPAISFCWAHQGMGTSAVAHATDSANSSEEFTFKGVLIRSSNGREFAFLRDPQHFLLPSNLLV